MGRSRTGTVVRVGERWRGRVTLGDGRRVWIDDVPPGLTKAQAKTFIAAVAKAVDEGGGVLPVKATDVPAAEVSVETVTEWSRRWIALRDARGNTSIPADQSRLDTHILPAIGRTLMTKVAKRELEQLVQTLDGKVRAGQLKWKTAISVWGTITKMFDDASRGKNLSLRVRDDNPSRDVRGPDRGRSTQKVYLYPSEFLQLVSCEEVPLRWRITFTLALYLYSRAAEIEALRWEDIDLERGTVLIQRGIDRYRLRDKETKTGRVRPFTIEPTLLPLLRVLHERSGGVGRVITRMYDDSLFSVELKRHLKRAGVTRRELFTKTPTRQWMTFHDLRRTGITWMAIRGDSPLVIQQRAGHDQFTQTQKYIAEAEVIRQGFGEVFPELPVNLIISSQISSQPTGRPRVFQKDRGGNAWESNPPAAP